MAFSAEPRCWQETKHPCPGQVKLRGEPSRRIGGQALPSVLICEREEIPFDDADARCRRFQPPVNADSWVLFNREAIARQSRGSDPGKWFRALVQWPARHTASTGARQRQIGGQAMKTRGPVEEPHGLLRRNRVGLPPEAVVLAQEPDAPAPRRQALGPAGPWGRH